MAKLVATRAPSISLDPVDRRAPLPGTGVGAMAGKSDESSWVCGRGQDKVVGGMVFLK
jgi:hypothetical protein